MGFELPQKVLFRHCDPAGIVFFPHYFEMMNDCVEAFFDRELDWPFEVLLRNAGIPTARITTRFTAPSRHGEHLNLGLRITRVGRRSLTYRMTAHCAAELRFETDAVLVHVDASGRSRAWPARIAEKLKTLEEPEDAA